MTNQPVLDVHIARIVGDELLPPRAACLPPAKRAVKLVRVKLQRPAAGAGRVGFTRYATDLREEAGN